MDKPQPSDNRFVIGEKGLITTDKFLIGFCVAILPGFFGILANKPTFTTDSKFWAAWIIHFHIPACFCLLWHLWRWPVRMKARTDAIQAACEEINEDLQHAYEKLLFSPMKEGIKALPRATGKDGKDLVYKADYVALVQSKLETVDSKSPIMRSLIDSHSAKIAAAQKKAMYAPLDEPFAKAKQVVDQIARFGRYWLFLALAFCCVRFGLACLESSL